MLEQERELNISDSSLGALEDRVEQAVQRGLVKAFRELVTDDESLQHFWLGGLAAIRSEATKQTGKFVLSSLGALAGRLFFFVLVGSFIYALGGWTALATAWKAIFGNH